MLQISPDEFRNNQEKYMKMAANEDIQIIKNDRILFTLSNSSAIISNSDKENDE